MMLQSFAHELFHQLAVQSHRFFLELCLCIYKSQWGASSRTSRLLEPFSCFSSTQTFVDMPPPQSHGWLRGNNFVLRHCSGSQSWSCRAVSWRPHPKQNKKDTTTFRQVPNQSRRQVQRCWDVQAGTHAKTNVMHIEGPEGPPWI